MSVIQTVEKDSCAKSVLESSGAGSEVAAEAHTHQRETIAVYIGSGERIVHGGGHHRLPVISMIELLFAYRSTLARAVEGQAIIAAPCCRGGAEIEKLFETRIQTAVEDKCGKRLAGIVSLVEISG